MFNCAALPHSCASHLTTAAASQPIAYHYNQRLDSHCGKARKLWRGGRSNAWNISPSYIGGDNDVQGERRSRGAIARVRTSTTRHSMQSVLASINVFVAYMLMLLYYSPFPWLSFERMGSRGARNMVSAEPAGAVDDEKRKLKR